MSSFGQSVNNASFGKQWGRRWRITIKSLRDEDVPVVPLGFEPLPAYVQVVTIEQDGWTPEGLQITFDTTQTLCAWQWCDVSIYNMNAPTSQDLIKYGMTCQVEAGYMNGTFGTIFVGTIFQPLWEKEGTDWKLTLHCVVGMVEGSNNFIGQTVPGGLTQRDLVSRMVSDASNPLTLKADGVTNPDRLTRSTTYFGQANDLLQYVADSNDALMWFTDRTAHIERLAEDKTVPEWEVGTDNGLIGTPQQTEFGVDLKVLLQPDLIVRGQIKLKQSVAIRQLMRMPGTYPSVITQDYRYIIGSLRHYGDSRGNDWYTEITAFYNSDVLLSLFQVQN